MCGIAGFTGSHDSDRLRAMVASLHHRGPDANGAKEFAGCSLGHTRLRIIDLSPAGDQPMANEDDSVWLVFNGELYNFLELRRRLERRGHSFRSNTDTETIVHLYEERGDAFVEELRGMFAVALWDERRQKLVLARDRLGIKPLYIRRDGRDLSFASEVRALRRPTDRFDAVAIAGYLRTGWVPGPRTIVEGVEELPPAHTLVWHEGHVRQTAYWSPPLDAGATSEDGGAGLQDALSDAVRRHLVADVPVGVFLSSGVDSAVVTRLAAEAATDLRTFTVGFAGDEDDETASAHALATRFGVQHEIVHVSADDVLASLERIVGDMDQPTVDGVNSWVISKAVRDAGMVVALSGLGGDELFSGYSTFRQVPRLAHTVRLASALPPAVRALPANALASFGATEHSLYRRAAEAAVDGGWASSYAAKRGLLSDGELERLWPERPRDEPVITIPWDPELTGAVMVHQLELANYLPFQLLRDTDRMSMAHALEVRVPLLDDRVVHEALTLQSRSRGRTTKAALVDAVDPGLGWLAHQRKRTFTFPFRPWLFEGLRDTAVASLIALGDAGLGFDRRQLTALWDSFCVQRVDWRAIWGLTVLGHWLTANSGLTSPTARTVYP